MTPKNIIIIEPILLRTILSCGLLAVFLFGSLVVVLGVLGGMMCGVGSRPKTVQVRQSYTKTILLFYFRLGKLIFGTILISNK